MKHTTSRMKRLCLNLLCIVLFCTMFPMNVSATIDTPVIAMTYTPVYGSSDSFEGKVFMENGGSFDTSEYRISLYLQLSAGDTYWVKPTYAMPYTDVSEDGSFSIRYATGGYDQNATIIHIMLIPASYTPTSSFAGTRAKSLDYVKITRTSSGQVTVSPDREFPDTHVSDSKSTGLTAVGRRLAVNVGFYTDGSAPGSKLSEELITRQLTAVSDFADTVRFFGSAGELKKAYSIAYDMGFTVVGTAWLSGNETDDRTELDALISHCNNGLVRVACVGSETLLRGDLTPQQLVDKIRYVKDRLQDAAIPVTTAESIGILLEQPALRSACDILMPNCYPYWAGNSINEAAGSFAQSVASLRAKAEGKQLIISETGWPTAGQSTGKAVAGEAEAARYFEEIRGWSVTSGIPVIWFDAADEPWKAKDEGESGAHWGFLTSEMQLKEGYAGTDFFRSVYGIGGMANFKAEKCYMSGQFCDVSDTAWYRENVASAYAYGLMVGTSSATFAPEKHISVAEAITLACRMHDIFYGLPDSHPNEHSWYEGYVAYAVSEGIIRAGQFTDYTRPASRKEIAVILTAALPGTVFPAVKSGVFIPDVPSGADYYDAVCMLYRAGILTGFADGSFEPERLITRAEIAAIAARMADSSLRIAA